MKLKLLWSIPIILLVFFSPYCKQTKTGHWFGEGSPQKVASENAAPERPIKPATSEDVGQMKVVGPLSNWMEEHEDKPKSAGVPTYQASEQDRIILTPSSQPNNFLHTTFSLKTYACFQIQIPPGTVGASLSGRFESFTKAAGHERRSAIVQVLLLDEKEVRDFVQGNAGSATYATDPSAGQAVRWALHSDYKQPKKYYLVFNNPPGSSRTKSVKANFTVQFD